MTQTRMLLDRAHHSSSHFKKVTQIKETPRLPGLYLLRLQMIHQSALKKLLAHCYLRSSCPTRVPCHGAPCDIQHAQLRSNYLTIVSPVWSSMGLPGLYFTLIPATTPGWHLKEAFQGTTNHTHHRASHFTSVAPVQKALGPLGLYAPQILPPCHGSLCTENPRTHWLEHTSASAVLSQFIFRRTPGYPSLYPPWLQLFIQETLSAKTPKSVLACIQFIFDHENSPTNKLTSTPSPQ